MINRIMIAIKVIVRILCTLRVSGIPVVNDANADYIVWCPEFFTIRFYSTDNLQRVMATYLALNNRGLKVTIYTRSDIGRFSGKSIFFFAGDKYNVYGYQNYASQMVNISKNLEAQGNAVFPSSDEAKMWENKLHMHEVFDRLRVRSPKTELVSISHLATGKCDDFPFLLKEAHSCSSLGVHKISSQGDLDKLVADEEFCSRNCGVVLKQELLNMRRDLRVILVGGSIVWFYWRINLSEEWKPTSTGHGSKVDFDFFPEDWRQWIVDMFKTLDMRTGAFDIAWQGDDLKEEPFILEVSPFYQPNPKPRLERNLGHYGNWKKSFSLRDNYQSEFVKLMFDIQFHIVDEVLK
jgi:hypothetical protein